MVKQKRLLPLNIQFFAEGGEGAGAGDAATDTTATSTTDTTKTDTTAQQDSKTMTDEALEKIIQSRVDKITAQLGKEKAEAVAALEQMKKDKMTADELAKYEIEQEKKALAAEKEALLDKSNRLAAVNELTKVGLYDGGENAQSLLNIIVNGAKEEADIAKSVVAVKSAIDKIVAEKVKATFQENGRVPNGGGKEGNTENDPKTSFAEKLGKQAAERAKNSNTILDYYYNGGKK